MRINYPEYRINKNALETNESKLHFVTLYMYEAGAVNATFRKSYDIVSFGF